MGDTVERIEGQEIPDKPLPQCPACGRIPIVPKLVEHYFTRCARLLEKDELELIHDLELEEQAEGLKRQKERQKAEGMKRLQGFLKKREGENNEIL